MLDLRPEHLVLVRKILARHAPGVRAWAFGSRATGNAERFSDLDIALDGDTDLDIAILADLRHAFQESDLPITVDVLDLCAARPDFRMRIERERVPL